MEEKMLNFLKFLIYIDREVVEATYDYEYIFWYLSKDIFEVEGWLIKYLLKN